MTFTQVDKIMKCLKINRLNCIPSSLLNGKDKNWQLKFKYREKANIYKKNIIYIILLKGVEN